MSKVKVLPADVVSKIAAGEVVERPAAVVKELMENALDAGATMIDVQVKAGGKSLIVVKDNGSGIEKADMETLFTRHATSKIKSADDLDALLSLGFRGEALYSIAAVSEVTLKTRPEKSSDGWELFLRGGQREKFLPAAMPAHGTEIRVEEVFFNTPARKKFLKSDAAEFDHILHVFIPYALLFPSHHFVLTHNGRTIYDLKPVQTLAERASACLNLDVAHIIESSETWTDPGSDKVKATLVLGDINIQRPRRDHQYIFVNGRPVQHKNIAFHVNEAYRLIFPDGVHPFFIVFLELPPEDVDVNIHPTKREVRLRQEGRFTGFLRRMVEEALMTKGKAKEAGLGTDIFSFETPTISPHTPVGMSMDMGVPADRIVFSPQQRKDVGRVFSGNPFGDGPRSALGQSGQSELPSFFDAALPASGPTLKDRLNRAQFIGTFARKYHLFEEGESLFLVDQHAAQERILFEKFQAQIEQGKVEVQHFLTPVIIKLTPGEILAWEEFKEGLRALGFETTLFDQTTIAVQTYPTLLTAPEKAIRTILGGDETPVTDRDALARRACRASVMTGDRMDMVLAVHQLKELVLCQDPMTCPHGRPVFIELKTSFLDRQFLRT